MVNDIIRFGLIIAIILWFFGYLTVGFLPEGPYAETAAAQENEIPEDAEIVDPSERWYISSIESSEGEFLVTVNPTSDSNVVAEYADIGAQLSGSGVSFAPPAESETITNTTTISVPATDTGQGQIGELVLDNSRLLLHGEAPTDTQLLTYLSPNQALGFGALTATGVLTIALLYKSRERFDSPKTGEQIARDEL